MKYGANTLVEREERKAWGRDEKMVKYCTEKASAAFSAPHALVVFDKPGIETQFCFGYHASVYDTEDYNAAQAACSAARQNVRRFIRENIGKGTHNTAMIHDLLEFVRNGYAGYYSVPAFAIQYWRQPEDCLLRNITWGRPTESGELVDRYGRKVEHDALMTADEALEIVAILRAEQRKFYKRLQTYLKKYGLDKCHFWTYWLDA